MLDVILILLGNTAPNRLYEAKAYYNITRNHTHGILATLHAPNNTNLKLLALSGTPTQRGRAHGTLLAHDVIELVEHALPAFYKYNVDKLVTQLKWLPKFLQPLVEKLAGEAADEAFELALDWLEHHQRARNNASDTAVYEEIRAIADGACAVVGCDAESVRRSLLRANLLPELIRMQCSMLGAWGDATARGGAAGAVVQLRALDFGGGPFANRQILIVQRPASSSGAPLAPFAALSFPGFAAVVTGFNPTFALSEKVNDLAGGGIPPGSYDGESVALVLRRLVQYSRTHADALDKIRAATRTWGVWLGLGDAQGFAVARYLRASADDFDDETLPPVTTQPEVRHVAYVDKHPQPSTDLTMSKVVQALASGGNINATGVAQNVPRLTHSGDVHIAVYEFAADTKRLSRVLLATGTTNAQGNFEGPSARYAYNAPFLDFDAEWLWKLAPALVGASDGAPRAAVSAAAAA